MAPAHADAASGTPWRLWDPPGCQHRSDIAVPLQWHLIEVLHPLSESHRSVLTGDRDRVTQAVLDPRDPMSERASLGQRR